MKMRFWGAFALFFAMLVAGPAWAQDFPQLTGRVVDQANILSPADEAALTQKLADLETQSQRQLVVATIADLQGYNYRDYAYQLGRHWGIGDEQRNDGVILMVAPNERKVAIEVGYGLEPILTDGMSYLIYSQTIVPKFKAGDLPGGINAGVDAIIQQLTLPPEEAAKVAALADQQASADKASEGKIGVFEVIFILLLLFFFVIPVLRGLRGGRRYGGGAPVIIWGGDDWGGGGRGGGGFGGGGFGGGGGFSGGGGSFGGGGAGGGW